MNSEQRFSAQQALQLLQSIADDDSGDNIPETDNDSEYEVPRCSIYNDSSSSNDEVVDDQAASSDSKTFDPDPTNIDSGGRGGRDGRGGQGGRGGRGGQRGGRGPRRNQDDDHSPMSNVARDGTVWHEIEPGVAAVGRTPSQNILRETPGPTAHAKRNIVIDSAISAFSLLIDEALLRNIQISTQQEAHRQLGNDEWIISVEELNAFIAILFARGALGANTLAAKDLWNKTWGPPFFGSVMSRNRFLDIMRYLRFDVRSTRSVRLQTDKFGLASDPWNRFISNCQSCYKPGENIAIDEQLFPTKVRCKWTQYIASKPDKFGIKFWLAVDVASKYLVNGFPYLGKDETRPTGMRLADHVVMKLMEPYFGKGRNVTTDNFFTSLSLAKDLQLQNTSIVGTVNRVRRELPPSAAVVQNKELYSSIVLKHDMYTLTVYKCKPNKNVVLMSSLHQSVGVALDPKKIPETIEFYNSTKYGVDVVDQMARKYSVKASSRRWPVQVFYNILDLAAINSWILYKETTGASIKRRDFILKLADELSKPYAQGRAVNIRASARDVIDETDMQVRGTKRRKCQVARCKGNKTCDSCSVCKKAVCGVCTAKALTRYLCVDCDNHDSDDENVTYSLA